MIVMYHSSDEIAKQNKHYPERFRVVFRSATNDVSSFDGEYTLPEARSICMAHQDVKCTLYREDVRCGYVDYDGSFFLQ